MTRPLYVREGNHAPIHWEPDDIETGKEAIENVLESDPSYPVQVSDDTAEVIRDEYAALNGGSN